MKRPHRVRFFDAIAEELGAAGARSVLELGSGPGFLALHLRTAAPHLRLTLLDFSAAMHELARERLGPLGDEVTFVEASFREPQWTAARDAVDAVVTVQAVHELRHKRHAVALHAAVRSLLVAGGVYLVCDHYVGEDGMKNDELFMTVDEQREALRAAGFEDVELVLCEKGLVLHRARRV